MIPYASHTNGARNLAELRRYGWRLLRTPFTTGKTNHGFGYALDNGAWRAHQQEIPFDESAFVDMLGKHAAGADWIVSPDIVSGGMESLAFSLSWLDRLRAYGQTILIPVQDGMSEHDVYPHIGPRIGIFVGGSTEFKESTAAIWGRLASECSCLMHVGRVNSARRIAICGAAGATSFDGSGASKFSVVVRGLTMAAKQADLFAPAPEANLCPQCGQDELRPDVTRGETDCVNCGWLTKWKTRESQ